MKDINGMTPITFETECDEIRRSRSAVVFVHNVVIPIRPGATEYESVPQESQLSFEGATKLTIGKRYRITIEEVP